MRVLLSFAIISSLFVFTATALAAYEAPGSEGSEFYDMKVDVRIQGEKISIRYSLPLDLTGMENHIEASGRILGDGFALLSGPKADLSCDLLKQSCDVAYQDLNVDLNLVQSRLEAQGLPLDIVERKLKISREFELDPIGVVHFD